MQGPLIYICKEFTYICKDHSFNLKVSHIYQVLPRPLRKTGASLFEYKLDIVSGLNSNFGRHCLDVSCTEYVKYLYCVHISK